MLSNLINQLREADALDKLDEVYRELPQTRADLGYPPLVTPTSQIVGVQAVMNVLGGERYKLISNEVKDYCYGLYGRPPAPIDPDVRRKCLTGYARGETPIDCRPADVLAPEMPAAWEAIKGISQDLGDALIYALYPRTGLAFLRFKHGLDAIPPGERPKTLEEIKRQDGLIKKVLAGEDLAPPAPPAPAPAPFDPSRSRAVRVAVDGEVFEVHVEFSGDPPSATAAAPKQSAPPAAAPKPAPAPAPAAPKPNPGGAPGAVLAPMPGVVVRHAVKEGDAVKRGQPVLVLEAMKMENTLPAPIDGVVKSLIAPVGATVARGEALALIE
jgi:biotin carboxyl carrier protein